MQRVSWQLAHPLAPTSYPVCIQVNRPPEYRTFSLLLRPCYERLGHDRRWSQTLSPLTNHTITHSVD